MKMKFVSITLALAVLAAAPATFAAVDYTAYVASGSGDAVSGALFTADTTNANATFVGYINVGSSPIALTGMAYNPVDQKLYGITTQQSPNFAASLVIIDPLTANATLVGAGGITKGSDITFSSAGTLYIWNQGVDGLKTVNLTTGAETTVGTLYANSVSGGALALKPGGGPMYVSVNGASGTFDTVNPATGVKTAGPTLSGAPYSSGSLDSMDFRPTDGALFAANNSGGFDQLVSINPATGVVTNIGALPINIDGIAFVPTPAPEPASLSLLAFASAAILIRRRRPA